MINNFVKYSGYKMQDLIWGYGHISKNDISLILFQAQDPQHSKGPDFPST